MATDEPLEGDVAAGGLERQTTGGEASGSTYCSRRVYAAATILILAAIGHFNPGNFVVVDRLLNHPFAATLIIAFLTYDALQRAGSSGGDAPNPTVGRVALAILVTYWIVWMCALGSLWTPWASIALGAALIWFLAINGRDNRWAWPMELLALPLLFLGLLSPLLGGFGLMFSNHGAAPSAHPSPYSDARVDSEQVDGSCSGITNWLRRGEGITAREAHLGGDCSGFDFTAADRLEVTCYSSDREQREYIGRTIIFDPITLRIYSDTGEADC